MYQIHKSQRLHSLDPFNRAGTTVKRVFYFWRFTWKRCGKSLRLGAQALVLH